MKKGNESAGYVRQGISSRHKIINTTVLGKNSYLILPVVLAPIVQQV